MVVNTDPDQERRERIERGRYEPLYRHISGLRVREWRATFGEIESVLGFALPPSARRYSAWWANDPYHVQALAWVVPGWKTAEVDLDAETLMFKREQKSRNTARQQRSDEPVPQRSMDVELSTRRFLPGVPGLMVEEMYIAAPGNEIESGKFDHPESSARLAANAFGYFLERPEVLPPLPGCEDEEWPATHVALEQTVRLPWRGGRHPVLDVLVVTSSALIGIESKRFEPFRRSPVFSNAYWRPEWGDCMKGYECVRDRLHDEQGRKEGLDRAQLVKHALALRTEVHRMGPTKGLKPILLYIHAEPAFWPLTGEPVEPRLMEVHRDDVEAFAENVGQDEVRFVHCTYQNLLSRWMESVAPGIRGHAEAVLQCFSP